MKDNKILISFTSWSDQSEISTEDEKIVIIGDFSMKIEGMTTFAQKIEIDRTCIKLFDKIEKYNLQKNIFLIDYRMHTAIQKEMAQIAITNKKLLDFFSFGGLIV